MTVKRRIPVPFKRFAERGAFVFETMPARNTGLRETISVPHHLPAHHDFLFPKL